MSYSDKILITGANGFIGKNLYTSLSHLGYTNITRISKSSSRKKLISGLQCADIVFHFAGVNRSSDDNEFTVGNCDLTQDICDCMDKERPSHFVFSSSQQVHQSSRYGQSKKEAEKIIQREFKNTRITYTLFRLTNVFGKWCRPHYNSVVATFCFNLTRNIKISISNKDNEVRLVYIDDVVFEMCDLICKKKNVNKTIERLDNEITISLGELTSILYSFRDSRKSLFLPNFSNPFIKKLYATYVSYLAEDNFSYFVKQYSDTRGSLYEIVKSEAFGQVFFSSTKPGVTRGNHFHHTKVEKFIVVKGKALIRFRNISTNKVVEYKVTGGSGEIVDIPVGYTHNIKNIGAETLLVIFYSNEILNKQAPDTYFEEV